MLRTLNTNPRPGPNRAVPRRQGSRQLRRRCRGEVDRQQVTGSSRTGRADLDHRVAGLVAASRSAGAVAPLHGVDTEVGLSRHALVERRLRNLGSACTPPTMIGDACWCFSRAYKTNRNARTSLGNFTGGAYERSVRPAGLGDGVGAGGNPSDSVCGRRQPFIWLDGMQRNFEKSRSSGGVRDQGLLIRRRKPGQHRQRHQWKRARAR